MANLVPTAMKSGMRTWWSIIARSPAAWSSACLYLMACALLLTGALTVPMGDHYAHPVDVLLAAVCAVLAGLCAFGGRRLGRSLPHVVVVLGIAVTTAAIAVSHTFAGQTYPAFGYVWSTVYLAYFLARRAVVSYVLLIAASFALALGIAAGQSHALALDEPVLEEWIVVVASVVALAFVLKVLVDLLEGQAEHDPLTGTLNRNGLERQAAALRAACARRGSPVTLVAIDLDQFKDVNDDLGHVAGDQLLVDVTGHWQGRLRRSDLLGRIGGDEFVLILAGMAPSQVANVLDDLRDGSPLRWSAGATEVLAGEPMKDAFDRADEALYQEKEKQGPRPGSNR